MLKRPRASSPPPWASDSPSFEMDQSFESNDFLQNVSKRRRILPPVLDGRVRGLPTEDELWPEDDGNWNPSEQPNFTMANWWEQAGAYKDANVLLHQLHVEHQVRAHHIGASTTLGSSSSSGLNFQSSNVDSRHSNGIDKVATDPRNFDQRTVHASTSSSRDQPTFHEEPNIVRSRYEENNRFLGSIVRRRMEEHGNVT